MGCARNPERDRQRTSISPNTHTHHLQNPSTLPVSTDNHSWMPRTSPTEHPRPQQSFRASPGLPPSGGPCRLRPNVWLRDRRGAHPAPSSGRPTVEPGRGRRLPWAAAPRAASSSTASSASGGGRVPRRRGRCIPPLVAVQAAPWRRAEHPRVRPGLLATSSCRRHSQDTGGPLQNSLSL